MVLFLSASFLRRLHLTWKPELKAFLIGERNLNFFTPDSIFEVSEIAPATIDDFLKKQELADRWQLLGFLSREIHLSLPGYIQVITAGSPNPKDWQAWIQIPDETAERKVEIKTPIG